MKEWGRDEKVAGRGLGSGRAEAGVGRPLSRKEVARQSQDARTEWVRELHGEWILSSIRYGVGRRVSTLSIGPWPQTGHSRWGCSGVSAQEGLVSGC